MTEVSSIQLIRDHPEIFTRVVHTGRTAYSKVPWEIILGANVQLPQNPHVWMREFQKKVDCSCCSSPEFDPTLPGSCTHYTKHCQSERHVRNLVQEFPRHVYQHLGKLECDILFGKDAMLFLESPSPWIKWLAKESLIHFYGAFGY